MKLDLLADHPEFVSTIARWYQDEWGNRVAHIAKGFGVLVMRREL